MLPSQYHVLHQSNIPELDLQSRLLHVDSTIPGSQPCQLLLHIILSSGCSMLLSQDHNMLHQSNISELDLQSRILRVDSTIPG